MPLRYQSAPLSGVGSLLVGGRYDPKGSFEALYTAETAEGALRELAVVVRSPDGSWLTVPTAPYLFVTVEYDLSCVVDLTDHEVLAELRIEPTTLVADRKLDVLRGVVPPTHEVGAAARLAGVEALHVPSARDPSLANVVVILDRLLTTSGISVYEPRGFEAEAITSIAGARSSRSASRE